MSELRATYNELIGTYRAMRATLDESIRTFKREYRRCRPEDEAALARKFQLILDTLRKSESAGAEIATENLGNL